MGGILNMELTTEREGMLREVIAMLIADADLRQLKIILAYITAYLA